MPLTATARPPKAAAPTRIRLQDLQDQLDREWALLRKDNPTDGEVDLRAYFHADIRPALYWIGRGDPYNWQVPEQFQGERLGKMVGWLRTITDEQAGTARAAQVRYLRQCWPAYRDRATPPVPNGMSLLELEVLPLAWEGVVSLWQTDEYVASLKGDETPQFLPRFSSPEVEGWYCACLAVLYLNRQTRHQLSDLSEYPAGDGR